MISFKLKKQNERNERIIRDLMKLEEVFNINQIFLLYYYKLYIYKYMKFQKYLEKLNYKIIY